MISFKSAFSSVGKILLLRRRKDGVHSELPTVVESRVLRALSLDNTNFSDSNLLGLDFSGSSLVGADFSRTVHLLSTLEDARPVQFFGCDLDSAIFEGSDLCGANFAVSNLTDVNFSGSVLISADFRGAVLRGAIFKHADLTGADFLGADLAGATFEFACMEKALSMNHVAHEYEQ